MTLPVANLTNLQRGETLTLVKCVFIVYAVVSFLKVTGHGLREVRRGQLLKTENSPAALRVRPVVAAIFLCTVILLLAVQSIFYAVVVLLGISVVLIENRRTAAEQFGFRRLTLRQLAIWSILICGAVIFIEAPLSQLMVTLLDMFHLPHPEQASVEMFKTMDRPSVIVLFILQATVLFPWIEELFFRGFLQTYLRGYLSTLPALLISSGVFAIAHANLGAMIPLWVLGLVLSVAYEHTGCLLLPIGVHACWNLFTALGLLYQKGTD